MPVRISSNKKGLSDFIILADQKISFSGKAFAGHGRSQGTCETLSHAHALAPGYCVTCT